MNNSDKFKRSLEESEAFAMEQMAVIKAKALIPPSTFQASSFIRVTSRFFNIDGGYILKSVHEVHSIYICLFMRAWVGYF